MMLVKFILNVWSLDFGNFCLCTEAQCLAGCNVLMLLVTRTLRINGARVDHHFFRVHHLLCIALPKALLAAKKAAVNLIL